jgi:hypothetical protein
MTAISGIALGLMTQTPDPQNDLDWETVTIASIFGFGFLALVTILIVVVVREIGSNKRAQAAIARDEAFKKLTERYDTFSASAASTQERNATDIAEVKRRLGDIEELLRSVN